MSGATVRALNETDPYETRLPVDAEYHGVYVRDERARIFGREQDVVTLRVTSPHIHAGLPVYWFLGVPEARGPRRLALSSAWARAYMVATGRRAPSRREARALRARDLLADCEWRFRVREVARDSEGVPRAEEQRYTVVRHLLGRASGTPPCLRPGWTAEPSQGEPSRRNRGQAQ